MKAIIGGTGVYAAGSDIREEIIETKYGKVNLDIVNIDGEEIVFLARHGKSHSTPPHLINYRANMLALKKIGVTHVYATAAVGSMNENYGPGDIVLVEDFLDFTKARPITFFEGGNEPVKHVDMSEPYCGYLREKFSEKAAELDLEIKGNAVYASVEGPRFETAAEIRMFKNLGGDIVGMTSVPEVVLAKELGLCYATIGIITNWATGFTSEIELHEIMGSVDEKRDLITETIIEIFKEGLDKEHCNCENSIIEL